MELSIEEKAKRYDEALEKGKQIQNTPYTAHWDIMKGVVEHLIPELKESEDERIRKDIIKMISNTCKGEWFIGSSKEECLSWFEKQGDKDKLIKELGEYKVKYTQEVLKEHIDSMNNKEDERIWKALVELISTYLRGNENGKIHGVYAKDILAWLEKKGEQKPTEWSKEDKQHIDSLMKRLDGLCRNEFELTRFAISEDKDWICSLKDRVLPQPKQGEQKPHEDIVDEINRKAFPNHYGGCAPVLEIKQTKICKMVGPDDPEHLADFKDLLPNIFIGMEMCIEGTMYRIKDIRTIICGDLYRQIIEVE